MRRATITISDELEAELEAFLATQSASPSLTSVVQAALREFLDRQRYRERHYRPPVGPLRIEPAAVGSGAPEGSIEHDRELATRA